jgi:hypothetical protein
MDKVNTKSVIKRLHEVLTIYGEDRINMWRHTFLEFADELAAQKEHYRVLEDEMLVMMDERNASEARSNLLACALRSLLSKCACCGGTGEVGTGIIQMEHPAMMSCFVCAGERQILLKECGK